jgi:hypothetical protein
MTVKQNAEEMLALALEIVATTTNERKREVYKAEIARLVAMLERLECAS